MRIMEIIGAVVRSNYSNIVKVLEFTAMITQTSWIQNIVIDTMKE